MAEKSARGKLSELGGDCKRLKGGINYCLRTIMYPSETGVKQRSRLNSLTLQPLQMWGKAEGTCKKEVSEEAMLSEQ